MPVTAIQQREQPAALYNPRDLISWTVQLTDSLGIVPACIFFRTSFSRKMRPISSSTGDTEEGRGTIGTWYREEEEEEKKGIKSIVLLSYLSREKPWIREEGGWEAMFISILKSELPRLVGRIYITLFLATVYCCIFKSLFTTDSKICSEAVGGLLRIKVKEP